MPDLHGWHTVTTVIESRVYRWHYCAGADRDTLVLDTPGERRQHQRACDQRQQIERERAERERLAAATERLRTINALRRAA
jgi:hypothetical protein